MKKKTIIIILAIVVCIGTALYIGITTHRNIKFNENYPTLTKEEIIDTFKSNYEIFKGAVTEIEDGPRGLTVTATRNGLYTTSDYKGYDEEYDIENVFYKDNILKIINELHFINITSEYEFILFLQTDSPNSKGILKLNPGFQLSDTLEVSEDLGHNWYYFEND